MDKRTTKKSRFETIPDKLEWFNTLKITGVPKTDQFNPKQLKLLREYLESLEVKPKHNILCNIVKVLFRFPDENDNNKIREYFYIKQTKNPQKIVEFLSGKEALTEYRTKLTNNVYTLNRSKDTLKYWLEHGFSLEDAEKNRSEFKHKKSIAMKAAKRSKYEHHKMNPYCIEYWKYRGLDEEEAEIKISEQMAKTSMSLEAMSDRMGEDAAIRLFLDIRKRVKMTKAAKPVDEFRTIRGSKAANKFYIRVYKACRRLGISRDDIHFGVTGSREYVINSKEGLFFYDFTIKSLKIMSEYNGLMYHVRDITNFKSPFIRDPLEKFERDKLKIQTSIDAGFNISIIWEDDNLSEQFNKLMGIIHDRLR